MTTTTFDVPDIHCGHCATSIEGAVQQLPGISEVSVRIDDRAVDVTFDEASVVVSSIVAAIEDQGYAVAGS